MVPTPIPLPGSSGDYGANGSPTSLGFTGVALIATALGNATGNCETARLPAGRCQKGRWVRRWPLRIRPGNNSAIAFAADWRAKGAAASRNLASAPRGSGASSTRGSIGDSAFRAGPEYGAAGFDCGSKAAQRHHRPGALVRSVVDAVEYDTLGFVAGRRRRTSGPLYWHATTPAGCLCSIRRQSRASLIFTASAPSRSADGIPAQCAARR